MGLGYKGKFTGDKIKNKFIKPEDIVIGIPYAFTFNPDVQPKFRLLSCGKAGSILKNPVDCRKAIQEWYQEMFTIFHEEIKNMEVEMKIELSSSGRFHLHGYAMIRDIAAFYAFDVPVIIERSSSEMDTLTIDTVEIYDEQHVWEKYINKQKHFMETFCIENLIPYAICSSQ